MNLSIKSYLCQTTILMQLVIFLFYFFTINSHVWADQDYPGRTIYSNIPIIETAGLFDNYNNYTIIDVRSKHEFLTLHMKNAIHLSISTRSFARKLKKIKQVTGNPLVFYCNGHSCYKSYKAARKAKTAGIDLFYAYDSGIFDWTKAHPEKSVLLGKTPVDLDNLISKPEFTGKLINPSDFLKLCRDHKNSILDIRDPLQRGGISFFTQQTSISLDEKKKLSNYLKKYIKRNKGSLLVYDAAGKQIRWFQYYLKHLGIKDYYFMKGGAKGFYKLLRTDFLAPKR